MQICDTFLAGSAVLGFFDEFVAIGVESLDTLLAVLSLCVVATSRAIQFVANGFAAIRVPK